MRAFGRVVKRGLLIVAFACGLLAAGTLNAAAAPFFILSPVALAIAAINLAGAAASCQMVALTIPVTTIQNPINIPAGGALLSVVIAQDSTGARAFALDTAYLTAFGRWGITAANLAANVSTAPNSQLALTFASDGNGNLTLLNTYPPTLIATAQ